MTRNVTSSLFAYLGPCEPPFSLENARVPLVRQNSAGTRPSSFALCSDARPRKYAQRATPIDVTTSLIVPICAMTSLPATRIEIVGGSLTADFASDIACSSIDCLPSLQLSEVRHGQPPACVLLMQELNRCQAPFGGLALVLEREKNRRQKNGNSFCAVSTPSASYSHGPRFDLAFSIAPTLYDTHFMCLR